jgi:predicted DNA-binding ribbon-helix-helix protein
MAAPIWGADFMKSLVVKRSIVIDRHKTSVSLEDAFWSNLKEIAHSQGVTLSEMVAEIDRTRQQGNLSSAIRLFVLDHVRTNRIGAAEAVGNDQTMPGVAPTAGRNVAG